MPAKKSFKKTTLHLSMNGPVQHRYHSRLCMSLFLMMGGQQIAQAEQVETPVAIERNDKIETLADEAIQQGVSQNKSDAIEKIENALAPEAHFDSVQMLEQQQNLGLNQAAFQPIQFEDLEELPIEAIDQNLANEIYQVAEQAKKEAAAYRQTQQNEMVIADVSKQELTAINQAPVNVDQLMQSIRADSQIIVERNENANTLASSTVALPKDAKEPNFFKRLLYRIRPGRQISATKVPRINADVIINSENTTAQTGLLFAKSTESQPLENLKTNIAAKLSSFTQESFGDYASALPQLRELTNQAAQAVGFYNAAFKFEKISDSHVRVIVTPNEPVIIEKQNIEFSGAGADKAQFQVIGVLPEQEEGDVFNHGAYDKTKARIVEAANNNGYFDAYWRLHDVKVAQPQNTADIQLKYETGDRYKLGHVEFRMSDPTREFSLDPDVLESLVTWKEGADYTFWRVNGLANNLTNSRYFNYTLVDAVKPDPIEKPLELAPDLQLLVDQQKLNEQSVMPITKTDFASDQEVTQNVVNEDQFAGVTELENGNLGTLQTEQDNKNTEQERLKQQAREQKEIPVIVTLNADRLNSAEVGLGYGTDTGTRLRGQYRRAIVNKRGHSFDANLELSKIRQSIDARYNIPYHHPLNDYISLVGGYEREEREDVVKGNGLTIESAVIGADRIIKNPRGRWQHSYGVRYRMDRLDAHGSVDPSTYPPNFLGAASGEQQSLLFGYEISRSDSNKRVNPTKGFKQTYKVEVGSENLLTDVNMAIANAGWRFIYSLGDNADHQFVGRADLGYIFTEDFNKVPYNLRYFSGGDQSIRGFDYKSLSPEIDGFKIGGQALGIGSLEYNYQFKEGWRAAVFADAGNAYDKDLSNPTAYGAGLGIRWASPIGPIRIDVASGLSDDNKPIRIHFFIGSQL